MSITQSDIDEATMIAKNGAYKLAYELSLEAKYGGNIDCCLNKLKLLWMWANTMACQYVAVESEGFFQLLVTTPGSEWQLFAGDIAISPVGIVGVAGIPNNVMEAAIDEINDYQSDYVATLDTSGSDYVIRLTGPCSNLKLKIETNNIENRWVISGMSDGHCPDTNCLTDESIKKLIAKIKSTCTN